MAGASGRMGRAVIALVQTRDDLVLGTTFGRVAATTAAASGQVLPANKPEFASCDVIVDFTEASASCALASACAARGGPPLIIGATGFSPQEDAAIRAAATRIAIVKSGNFSLGVNLLAGLVEQAARRLAAADWDIEIFEAHHRRKADAPSGTALLLGEAAARGRATQLGAPQGRIPGHTRKEGEIGFSVLRGGGIIGEHSVVFAAEDEILTLSHSARDRALFARGALQAAIWAMGREPGLYDMMDVLGIRDRP